MEYSHYTIISGEEKTEFRNYRTAVEAFNAGLALDPTKPMKLISNVSNITKLEHRPPANLQPIGEMERLQRRVDVLEKHVQKLTKALEDRDKLDKKIAQLLTR